MMSAFQSAIRQSETGLLIIGFGFNDNHIAEPILSAIRSNLSLKVVVCDPMLAPNDTQHTQGCAATHPHISQIRYLIENGDARLSLINGTFEEIVPMLPDIAALTDLEQHFERIRMLKGLGNE
jgi:biotin synthase-related radical SAM superfamily protein